MPISCTPSDLMAAAAGYDAIPPGQVEAVKIMLLASIAGDTRTPGQLVAAASGFAAIPQAMQLPVQNMLLGNIVNA